MCANVKNNSRVCLPYQRIKLAYHQFQVGPESLDESSSATIQKQAEAAEKLITLVLKSDVAKDYKVRDKEVDFVVETLQEQFDNRESYQLSLQLQGLSEQQLRQAISQDLLCEKVLDAQSRDYPAATEQEAINYYQNNSDKFSYPERRKASHILITINDQFPENRRAAVMLKITDIRAQLMNNLGEFATIALSESECPTALNNGLIGTVSRGQLYPELDKVLFLMQEETISSIVETEIGLHLLLCHEIIPASRQSQDDAVPIIQAQINAHRRKKCERKWLSSLLVTA
ncbi:nitrogen fixation protein NifM [Psychromonas sp. MME2]|uniref:nitrogen fixation protein NifM n=1 Tax=unclassified Psychromonas TaxID=2614957 RepID=UPI00339C071D